LRAGALAALARVLAYFIAGSSRVRRLGTEMLGGMLGAWLAGCLAVLLLLSARVLRARWGAAALPGRRLLLVTAHPDDEAMFFAPLLLSAAAAGVDVHIICLSTGVPCLPKGGDLHAYI
jgi:hypothetical protein